MSNYYRTLNEGFDKYINEMLGEQPKNTRTYLGESAIITEDILDEEKYIINYSIDGKNISEDKWNNTLASLDIKLTADQKKELDAGKEIKVKGSDYTGTEKEITLRTEKKKIQDDSKSSGGIIGKIKNIKTNRLAKKSMDAAGEVRSDYKLSVSMQGDKPKLQLGDKVIAVYPNLQTLNNVITSLKNQVSKIIDG